MARSSRLTYGLAGLLVVLTVTAYWPALQGEFVWDDDRYVTENPTLRTLDGLRQIWLKPDATVQYYPLTFTTFWIEYHLWQLKPFGYHLVNVLLHSFGAILLWFILRRLSVRGAWLAAALFAVHPVHVESVAWITERKNVLSGVFYFAALLLYFHFRQPVSGLQAKSPGSSQWWAYVLAILLFLAALLSKTATCTLPIVILLVMWFKHGRLDRRDIALVIPLFLMALVLGLTTVWVEQHEVGAEGDPWSLSWIGRCLVAGRAIWFYAGKLVWPTPLSFIYPRWEIDPGLWWQYLYLCAVLAGLIGLWQLRHTIGKTPLVAALFFVVTLAPALGFVNVYFMQYAFVADHFQYLASIGPIALLAGLLTRYIGKAVWRHSVSAVMLILLMVLTWQQTHVYRNLESLWHDTLAKNPDAWLAHNNLSAVLNEQDDMEGALHHCREALKLKPDYVLALNNMGIFLAKQGEPSEAAPYFWRAIQLEPKYAPAYKNLGHVLLGQGKIADAIKTYRQALALKPDWPEVANHLAWILATHPDSDIRNGKEAVDLALRACTATYYKDAGYTDTLAAAYAETGQFAKAVAAAQWAIALAETQQRTELLGHLQGRLQQYVLNRPYRTDTCVQTD